METGNRDIRPSVSLGSGTDTFVSIHREKSGHTLWDETLDISDSYMHRFPDIIIWHREDSDDLPEINR